MGKLSLLKEYLKLALTEAGVEGPKPPFQLMKPGTPAKKGHTGDYVIYREFPVVPSPEMMQALKVDETDLDESGLLWGEHEIGLEVDFYYEKPERMTRDYPGTPGGYSIDGWSVVSFNGLMLSPEDAKNLENYMGNLTDSEEESILEQKGEDEPDYEPDYDPYY